jgi:phosphoserine phosphatase
MRVFSDMDGVLLPQVDFKGVKGVNSGYLGEIIPGQRAGWGLKAGRDVYALYVIGLKAKLARAGGTPVKLTSEEKKIFQEYSEFLPPLKEMNPGLDFHAIYAKLREEGKPVSLKLLEEIGARYPISKGAREFAKSFGKDFFIVSMTPEPIVKAVGKRLDVKGENVFASGVDSENGFARGRVQKTLMQGVAKARVVRNTSGKGKKIVAIGDSLNDFEMLEEATKAEAGIAVGFLPSEALVEKLKPLENAFVFVEDDLSELREFLKGKKSKNAIPARECGEMELEKIECERKKQTRKFSSELEKLFADLTFGVV